MIKKVYTAILISLLAVSCTKSVVEPGGDSGDNAINFTPQELSANWAYKSSTRGTVVTEINDVEAIMVYAFQDGAATAYIDNVKASIDKATNIWGFNPAYYYPQSGTLDFLTYTPEAKNENGLAQTLDFNNKAVKFTYNLPNDDTNQPDFMVGEPQTNHSGTNQLGTINFQHALTQLTMSAKVATTTENNRYKITGFTLHNITTKAEMTYKVNGGMSNWSGTPDGDFIASDLGDVLLNKTDFKSVMVNGQTLFMVPQSITDNATIQIIIEDTEEGSGLIYRTPEMALPKTAWETGKHINLQFVFDVTNEDLVIPMTLEAKLRPWVVVDVDTDIDASIYAHLSVSSVPPDTTTEIMLYTNGEVVSVEANGKISKATLGTPASGSGCPISVKAAKKAGDGSIIVIINNSLGTTITKTFNISVQ